MIQTEGSTAAEHSVRLVVIVAGFPVPVDMHGPRGPADHFDDLHLDGRCAVAGTADYLDHGFWVVCELLIIS